MNVLKLVSQGGLAMMPLLVLSVIALAIVLERTLFFASLEWGGRDFRLRLHEYVRQRRLPECVLWLTGLRGAVVGVAQGDSYNVPLPVVDLVGLDYGDPDPAAPWLRKTPENPVGLTLF